MKDGERAVALPLLGRGRMCANVWKSGDEGGGWRYRFNVFRMCPATGHVDQQFEPEDLFDLAVLVRLLAFEIGTDGCLTATVRDDALCLAACMEQVLSADSRARLRWLTVEDEVATAIGSVLDYLRDEERADYESFPHEDHVYSTIQRVDRWLRGERGTMQCAANDEVH